MQNLRSPVFAKSAIAGGSAHRWTPGLVVELGFIAVPKPCQIGLCNRYNSKSMVRYA